MTFRDENEVITFIKKHLTVSPWVIAARKNHQELKALVTGEGFLDLLIHKIEKIESPARQVARKKYSKDIRDLFHRVLQPRENVFSASGGSVNNDISSQSQRDQLKEILTQFKGQKSINQYFAETYFPLADTDPNGIIFEEYREAEDIFPTYKSIEDIRYYKSDGQLLDVLIFEPKKIHKGSVIFMEYRVVDSVNDWRIWQIGSQFIFKPDLSFKHPFGIVPCTILSSHQKTGSELRISNLDPIRVLAEDYAQDKSVSSLYKKMLGFPKHWKYEDKCKACHGAGKTGTDGKVCQSCGGRTTVKSLDVTDIDIIKTPEDKDAPLITPNPSGFVSPDLETLAHYDENQVSMEDRVDATYWGTKRITNATNETATGRFIDVQPVNNKLSTLSKQVQWTHNQHVSFVISWINGQPVKEKLYHFSYGDRYILESADVIMDKYNKSRNDGANNVILDKLMDELILAQNQNNPAQLEIAQKKREVEPYIHISPKEVNDFYGAIESYKKVMFVDFWEIADTSKTSEQLKEDFKDYSVKNALPIKDNTE